jgi:hypothetical protein
MKNLDNCILSLTDKLDKTVYSTDKQNLLTAIEKLKEMQILENTHEQEMARIKANRKTMANVMDRLLDWLIHGKQNE